jgi:hypothetical protein
LADALLQLRDRTLQLFELDLGARDIALARLDLRVDLQLLADHFTISSLLEAIRTHLLATAVLIFTPSLWRRYRT